MEIGHMVHRLVRVALAIRHLKALGGTLTAMEDAPLKFCQTVPMFKTQMNDYRGQCNGQVESLPWTLFQSGRIRMDFES
jgi:hypothetical protein